MKFRYVLSAPSYLALSPSSESVNNPDSYKKFADLATDCVKKVKRDLQKLKSPFDIDVDILFNAFTEKRFGPHIRKYDTFGLSKLYADSGGLQIVTLGKNITPDLKKEVYATQSCSDYAMCFDEIPARSITKDNTKNSRIDIGNKMFYYDEHKQCAIKTANNIKEQCDVISNINDTTNVFYIIQGNTHEDMVEWFQHGATVVKDHTRIAGLALADTCMGTGQLESVEMFMAYRKIYDDFGANVTKKHIHLLGVGCVTRLLPLIYCGGNLLPNDITVSFDSTTISCVYAMGNFRHLKNTPVKSYEYKSYFSEIVDYFKSEILKHYPSFDEELFSTHYANTATSRARTVHDAPHGMTYVAQAHLVGTLMYQLFPFFSALINAVNTKNEKETHLRYLTNVKTYSDAIHWVKHHGKYVTSKRIKRHGSSLEEFF